MKKSELAFDIAIFTPFKTQNQSLRKKNFSYKISEANSASFDLTPYKR